MTERPLDPATASAPPAARELSIDRVRVSVVIPCLDERDYIDPCLDSVFTFDWDGDRLEVIVVDGGSRDGTRERLDARAAREPRLRVLHNERRITPAALNIGIRAARGDVIVRLDAHSTYAADYVRRCVEALLEHGADNVGGIWITRPRGSGLFDWSVSMALSSRFGVGNAHYRIASTGSPRWVDTVPYGCYRRDVLERVGLYDETLHRNEDIDLNRRLRDADGRILLLPDVRITYFVRSRPGEFLRHQFDNGTKVTFPRASGKGAMFSWRHRVPFAFVACLLLAGVLAALHPAGRWLLGGLVGAYLLVAVSFSARVALRERRWGYLWMLPVVFALLHLVYGTGSLVGWLRARWPGSKRGAEGG